MACPLCQVRLCVARYPLRLPTLDAPNNSEEGALGLLALSSRLAHGLRMHIVPMIEGMGEEDDNQDTPEYRA
jgi:hypothetical protein